MLFAGQVCIFDSRVIANRGSIATFFARLTFRDFSPESQSLPLMRIPRWAGYAQNPRTINSTHQAPTALSRSGLRAALSTSASQQHGSTDSHRQPLRRRWQAHKCLKRKRFHSSPIPCIMMKMHARRRREHPHRILRLLSPPPLQVSAAAPRPCVGHRGPAPPATRRRRPGPRPPRRRPRPP